MKPNSRPVADHSVVPAAEDLILQNVSTLLAPFNRNKITIKRETEIITDLEIDSVAVFDLIMEVEPSCE